jgi:hypothetical protein
LVLPFAVKYKLLYIVDTPDSQYIWIHKHAQIYKQALIERLSKAEKVLKEKHHPKEVSKMSSPSSLLEEE